MFDADLAEPEGPAKIYEFTKQQGLEIDLLINNAGFGQYGELTQVETQRLLDMVQVNCTAVVHLTRLYLADMVSRRRGDILILASTASFQAVPFISTYAATKAFDLLFAEGLAEEMKPHGIRVCALCPGSTESEFHVIAGQEKFTSKNQETAEKVARTGLQALAARQELRDLWVRQLSGRAVAANCAEADGDANCGQNVSSGQEAVTPEERRISSSSPDPPAAVWHQHTTFHVLYVLYSCRLMNRKGLCFRCGRELFSTLQGNINEGRASIRRDAYRFKRTG